MHLLQVFNQFLVYCSLNLSVRWHLEDSLYCCINDFILFMMVRLKVIVVIGATFSELDIMAYLSLIESPIPAGTAYVAGLDGNPALHITRAANLSKSLVSADFYQHFNWRSNSSAGNWDEMRSGVIVGLVLPFCHDFFSILLFKPYTSSCRSLCFVWIWFLISPAFDFQTYFIHVTAEVTD